MTIVVNKHKSFPLFVTYVLDRPYTADPGSIAPATATLSLIADDRTRVRHRFTGDRDEDFHLDLPRGTVLRDGDRLTDLAASIVVTIRAKPEPVYTITATSAHHLTRLAYHLGNRHVAIEIGQTYLRLQPDPVLRAMLLQLKAQIHEDVLPFSPEVGAYHGHAHDQTHGVPERSQSRSTTDGLPAQNG